MIDTSNKDWSEKPIKDKPPIIQLESTSTSFNPPTLKQMDALYELFCRNLVNFFQNSDFEFWNGYFEIDNGQTLFLDGIVVDVIVDDGEIWWKSSVRVI